MMRTMGIYPIMYPPVTPSITENPPWKFEKTGRPQIPRRMYKMTIEKEILSGKREENIYRPNVAKVIEIGPIGIEKPLIIHCKAVNMPM